MKSQYSILTNHKTSEGTKLAELGVEDEKFQLTDAMSYSADIWHGLGLRLIVFFWWCYSYGSEE